MARAALEKREISRILDNFVKSLSVDSFLSVSCGCFEENHVKRADRLYALMQRLKDGHLHTAEAMAQDLGVSVRTIYRDMETLAASGVPVVIWRRNRGMSISVGQAVMQGASWQK